MLSRNLSRLLLVSVCWATVSLQLLALDIIDAKVQTGWLLLTADSPDEAAGVKQDEADGVKQLLMDSMMQARREDYPMINKITKIFIEILKSEWHTTWVSFVEEIAALGKHPESDETVRHACVVCHATRATGAANVILFLWPEQAWCLLSVRSSALKPVVFSA